MIPRMWSRSNAVYLRLRFLLLFDFLIEYFLLDAHFFWSQIHGDWARRSCADLFKYGQLDGPQMGTRPASRRPDGTQIAAPQNYGGNR